MNKKISILLDAEVIIHFYKGDKLTFLGELFPNRLFILDNVLEELTSNKSSAVATSVENMMRFGLLRSMEFPKKDMKIFSEYATLLKKFGKGESACLAVCKFQNSIIASSNLADITAYCHTHLIAYITTMDILCIGLKQGKITESECDEFIKSVRSQGSRLPNKSIVEMFANFDQSKLLY